MLKQRDSVFFNGYFTQVTWLFEIEKSDLPKYFSNNQVFSAINTTFTRPKGAKDAKYLVISKTLKKTLVSTHEQQRK